MSISILAVLAIPEKEVTVSFKVDGKKITKTIRKGDTVEDNNKFNTVMNCLKNKETPEKLLGSMDVIHNINVNSNGFTVSPDGITCFVNNEPLPKSIGDRIMAFSKQGLDFAPLLKFWHNCTQNPDPVTKSDLFKFLEFNGHPITDDGCFIAYRAVRNDYMDKYTGTIFNGIGAVVTKPRSECNPDRNVTCSYGLHAAAFSYAKQLYGSFNDSALSDRLMEVKINPMDVVAIPTDYNQRKMRVCKYIVVAENDYGLINRTKYEPEPIKPEVKIEEIPANVIEDDERGALSVTGPIPEPQISKVCGHDGWKSQARSSNGRFLPKIK